VVTAEWRNGGGFVVLNHGWWVGLQTMMAPDAFPPWRRRRGVFGIPFTLKMFSLDENLDQ
jgi:hypothetical protein